GPIDYYRRAWPASGRVDRRRRRTQNFPERNPLPMATKNTDNPEYQGDLAIEERTRTQKPRRFAVVFHNDDYTTQEFVVQVLMRFFHKDVVEATHIMLQV